MLAFIDSPIQIAVFFVVVLIIFGPEKMKDIGKQLGRAVREIRRAGNEFKNTLDGDDTHYDSDYKPRQYDSYGNAYDSSTKAIGSGSHDYDPTAGEYAAYSTVPEEDLHPAAASTGSKAEEPHRGDFAASALSDHSGDYSVHSAPSAAPVAPSVPVYGVLESSGASVPRSKPTSAVNSSAAANSAPSEEA